LEGGQEISQSHSREVRMETSHQGYELERNRLQVTQVMNPDAEKSSHQGWHSLTKPPRVSSSNYCSL